ncbi:MAG: putative Ig domain-containing protein, partial [Planctomycetaceae bacterium]
MFDRLFGLKPLTGPQRGWQGRQRKPAALTRIADPLERRILLSAAGADAEILVNDSPIDLQWVAPFQSSTDAAADGTSVTVWTDRGRWSGNKDVFARRQNAQGQPISPVFRVNSSSHNEQRDASVSVAPDGTFVVVWQSLGQDHSGWGVYGQRYAADGARVGGEFRINQTTFGNQYFPGVAWLSSGGFVVTWSGTGVGDYVGVFARQYDSSGVPVTGEFRVSSHSIGEQRNATVAAAPDGGYLIAWDGRGTGDLHGIFARRFRGDGRPMGGEFRVSAQAVWHQVLPSASYAKDGSFVIVWQSLYQEAQRWGFLGWGVYGQRFSANGHKIGGEFRANEATILDQKSPHITHHQNGGFAVAWEGRGTGDLHGIFVREFDAAGVPVSHDTMVNTTRPGQQVHPSVADVPDGYMVVWGGYGFADIHGVFARRIDSELSVNLPPELPPIADRNAFQGETVQLTVTATDPDLPGDVLTYSLAPGAPLGASINSQTGELTWQIPANAALGDVTLGIRVTDAKGLFDEQSFEVTVLPVQSLATLIEGNSFLQEVTVPVPPAAVDESRDVRVNFLQFLDTSDGLPAVEDVFSITLWDQGTLVATLFSLAGSQADFTPGLVGFEGSSLRIDPSLFDNLVSPELRFQLLNSDADERTAYAITSIVDEGLPRELPPILLNANMNSVPVGGVLDLAPLSATTDLKLLVNNVKYDSAAKLYTAELRLRNLGSSTIGRTIVVVLPGLPAGVAVQTASGTDANGNPYLNFQPAVASGGLEPGAISDTVLLEIGNPGDIRFSLLPQILTEGMNRSPVIPPVGTLTTMPGGYLAVNLNVSDLDGDNVLLAIDSQVDLPAGQLRADGTLIFTPVPGDEGTYDFQVVANDGSSKTSVPVTLVVQPDPLNTTRVSGSVLDTNQQPIPGIRIEIVDPGNPNAPVLQTTTAADGSFQLETAGPLPGDTLIIHGEDFSGPLTFPFIAEKLPLLLGRDEFENAKNVIGRPIFLPALDMANAMPINPNQDTTVTTTAIPGAAVFVAAGTLLNQQGQPFTGNLGITQVPPDFTPAALPPNMRPDLVVTIQPGDMVFTVPAPISFPNTASFAPGTLMDLWSINPQTGQFDDVGDMRVSADGSIIETISGGIRNSSWHFPTPPPPDPEDPDEDDGNEDNDCEECKADAPGTSRVELHSGAVLEDHALVTYQSLGSPQGFGLHYDSLRADPRPIVHFGYSNVAANPNQRLVASMEIMRGDFMLQLPGHPGGQFGLQGGEHFWKLETNGTIRVALQTDFTSLPTGVYDYRLTSGLLQFNGSNFTGTTATQTNQIRVVNSVDSPFGAGWGLTGLQHIVENPDGSVLLIDGDGSELFFGAATSPGAPLVSPPGDFSTLVKLGGGTYQRTMTDQTVYLFNTDHQVASLRDRNGNLTQFNYDASGVIQSIVDSAGLQTTFTSANGRVTAITDPANRTTTLAYDARGNLIKLTDPDGTSRTWGYDSRHHITSEIDKRGFLEETFYDYAGRAERAVRKDGTEFQYDPVQTQILRPVSQTTDPINAPAASNVLDIMASYSDGNGNVTQAELDKQGQLRNTRDSEGRGGNVFRNDENLVIGSADSRGFTTDYSYDVFGNVTSITDRVGSATGGSLFLTGHDSDDHANGEYQRAGLDFLTFGREAATPAEIALRSEITIGYLGNGNASNNGAAASGYTARTFIDLDNAAWADTAFSGDFDILMIGTGGDFVFNSGSAALNAEADRFADFFNDGGGIYVNTDQGSIGQTFYNFLPTFGATQAAVGGSGVYSVTNEGLLIGLTEDIVDRDITHTEYRGVDTNLFRVFETHNQTGDPVAIGLFQGFIAGGLGGLATQFFTYDPNFAQITSVRDELGRMTMHDLDAANGNILSRRRVVGEIDDAANGETDDLVSSFTYTTFGLVDTITDPLGRVTNYDYDLAGRLTSITYAQGTADAAVMTYEYDLAGNRTAMVDGEGNRTEYQYDALNRLTRTIEQDPDGAAGPLTSPVTVFTYDAVGNLVTVTDARGNITTSVYDPQDRLVESIGPDPDAAGPLPAPVTRYTYDLAGNLEAMTDPNGNTTEYEYDSRNRRIAMTDPDGGVTQFGYDIDNNLAQVTDPVGNITRFAYDARSRLIEETDPLGATITYTYDAADNLAAKLDRNGRVTRFTYDEIDRLLTEEWLAPDDSVVNTVSYTYDAASNLLSLADNQSALAFTYDARNRVQTVDNLGTPGVPNVVLTYTYDDVSNVLTVSDTIDGGPGATTGYQYDGLNRLVSLNQSGANTSAKRVDFTYNPLGQYAAIDRFSDLAGTQIVIGTDYTYDAQNRLTRLDHQNAQGQSVAFYDYLYDAASRITQITDVDGVTSYGYDDRDQLTSADYTDLTRTDESYQYDANGNRVQSSQHGSGYVTGPANRLLSDGTYTYEYDAEGNMLRRTRITGAEPDGSTTREFTWDHRNRLIAIVDTLADGTPTQEVEFTYDTLNRRIGKAVDTTPLDAVNAPLEIFIYDREDIVVELEDYDGSSSALPQL